MQQEPTRFPPWAKGNLFLPFVLIAGLALMPAGRVTAQNFTGWPVTHVAAGGDQSLFTRTDGTLFGMGGNPYGGLGLGTTVSMVRGG